MALSEQAEAAKAAEGREETPVTGWTRLEASAGYWICMRCARVNRPEVEFCGGSVLKPGQTTTPEAVPCEFRRWHFGREDKVFFLASPTHQTAAE